MSAIPSAAVAVVSTIRAPGESIGSLVRYNLLSGVRKMYLFLDDPSDPCLDAVEEDQVEVIPCDADLRSAWAEWPEMRELADDEVMARQILNAEVAVHLARKDGCEWLLHLDADEVVDSGAVSIAAYLGAVDPSIEQVTFANLEVLPDRFQVRDYFRELTLFKRNFRGLQGFAMSATQRALAAQLACVPPRWFYYYDNGKSAVRLSAHVRPAGVHAFGHASGRPLRTYRSESPRVLHYMNAGFENFFAKYRTWGRFSDYWFGAIPIREQIGDFHLAARDVVMNGSTEEAAAFYRRHVVLEDPEVISRLIAAGLCERVDSVKAALMRGV